MRVVIVRFFWVKALLIKGFNDLNVLNSTEKRGRNIRSAKVLALKLFLPRLLNNRIQCGHRERFAVLPSESFPP